MNSTIHRQIEAIQRGETPKGYKKSQWGTIPSNWDIRPFNSLFSRITRRNDINNSNVLTISAQYGLVNQESFFNKSIASENKTNYFLLRKGDFAYNKSYSTGYPFGAIKPLIAYETGIVSPLYICFTPTAQNSCPEFYEHYFEGGMHNREIKAIAEEGARNHGLLNMSISDFFNSLLLVPPLQEQEAIAEILTQQDRLIDLKQRLIDEKRRQKKYLMQTLLTGKIRLPGFKGKWKKESFNSLFSRITRKNDIGNNNVLTISAQLGLVNQESFFNKSVASENKTNYFLLKKGDFAYNKSYSTGYPFGAIKPLVAYETGIVSPLYICFTPTDQNSCPKFYEHYFEGGMHNREIKAIAEEGARNHGLLNISIPDFFNTLLIVPPLPEQEAIAEVLSTADEELSLLERELEQEKLRKKALMQLLLTGLVRVEEL